MSTTIPANAWVSLALLGVTLVGAFLLSLRARGAQSLEQWSIASRGLGSVLIFMLMAGEIYTTFTFLGGSGWAYSRGAPAYYIIGYAAVGYSCSYWLLPAIWRRGVQWQVLSQPEYYRHAYRSPWLGHFVALIGTGALMPYLVLQLKGLGIIVAESSYGMIGADLAISIGTVATVVYVILSGVRGSAFTAALKDALVLATVLGLAFALPHSLHGGIGPMFDTLIAQRPDFFVLPERGLSGSWFSSTILMTVFGFWMWPHTFGSTFTARSDQSFRRNAVLMPLYQVILLCVLFIGFAAINAVPGLQGTDVDLALLRVTKQVYGPWVVGLVGAAGLLTALVPGSLIMMTTATILARLLQATPLGSNINEVRAARLLVVLVAVTALIFVFRGGQTLVTLLLFAYAIVTQLFPSLLISLWRPERANALAAFAGITTGVSIVAWTNFSGITVASAFPALPPAILDINVGVLALLANVLVHAMITVLAPRATGAPTLTAGT